MSSNWPNLTHSIGVFLIACVVQTVLWFGFSSYVDSEYWTLGATQLAHGVLPSFDSLIPVHPATSIILPAAGLIILGISTAYAIPITMTILLSAAIACIVYLCRTLRPGNLWWLGAVVLLALDARYLEMTIPSALAALISGIYILLILYIREKGISREYIFWLGVCGGVLLATRIDVGVEVIAVSLPYLLWLIQKKVFVPLMIAGIVFAAINPFLWVGIQEYAISFTEQMSIHLAAPNTVGYSILSLSLAITAFLIAVVFVCVRPTFFSMPPDFLLWLIAASFVLCGILLLSPHHPVRYFFPLIVIWEMVLPLLIFDVVRQSNFRASIFERVRYEYLFVMLFLAERSISLYLLWQ